MSFQLLIVQIAKSKGANQIGSNLKEGCEELSMLPKFPSVYARQTLHESGGHISCGVNRYGVRVHKCYVQICFALSIFSSYLCSTILCFLHSNHLGSQRLVSTFVS